MTTYASHTPALSIESLIAEVQQAIPGDWLSAVLSAQSNHWRLENEPHLIEADLALRALFLSAYRTCGAPKPRPADLSNYAVVQLGSAPPSNRPGLRRRTDDAYGNGFYAAAYMHSRTLIDRSPNKSLTVLLSGLSDFLRSGPAGLNRGDCGAATRVLEDIWEQMNIGWYN